MKEKTHKEEFIERELETLFPETADGEIIDVDSAWNKVFSRMDKEAAVMTLKSARHFFSGRTLARIAATILILIGLGAAAIYTLNSDTFRKTIVAATGEDRKNKQISLPDGSTVTLNRNTKLTYHANFGEKNRRVSLSGEAFFEIAADTSKPFTINAGKASVKVVGTSFNVITENIDSAVEVFVRTGKVMLSDNSGKRDLMLEPGYIGTMDSNHAEKSLNRNPNYMSWKDGKLDYDGQSLDIVFRDLKRVYNMDIKVDDPSILSNKWTSPIVSQSNDTIIRIICVSFNLSYTKDGNVYHLTKK
jgi:transmembrane sensor